MKISRLLLCTVLISVMLTTSYLSGQPVNEAGQLPLPEEVTSYFLGNPDDKVVVPKGGIVMMGGGKENDQAMKWFLRQADGGDILVLRASGSDGYQDYLYKDLGIAVNSVETLVFNARVEADYVIDKINKAEGIWFAGGNQQKYVDYWKGNAIEIALQSAIDRGAVVGGTSAGMAILGEYIWDGERIRTDFLELPYLDNIVTDTHYDARNRMDRHLGFITEIKGRGIAADEYTAIVIHPDGNTYVYGDEEREDFAYFIKQDLTYLRVRGKERGNFALNLKDW